MKSTNLLNAKPEPSAWEIRKEGVVIYSGAQRNGCVMQMYDMGLIDCVEGREQFVDGYEIVPIFD